MKKALFAVLALSLMFGAPALAGDTWTGEVLDMVCFGNGQKGAGHAGCAAKCLGDGNEMGLLVGDDVVKIDRAGSDADAIKTLEKLGGKAAKVTGKAMKADDGTVTVTVSAAEAA
ncbi:MAG: hypothetical protein OXG81_00585 [Acidobacteria bacterium]|nr:hypothetical protein [Acidobacteriota bacterium]MCY3966690.1 hypothetical protein [Acidobacteriota bacterium]